MTYGNTRKARFKAAQLNFWLMRIGMQPIWQFSYLIKDDE